MGNINIRTYFHFVVFMLMITTFFPLFSNNLPPIIRSHHIWTPVFIISLLLFIPKIFTHKSLIYLLIYSIVVLWFINTFWESMNDWNKNQIRNELYVFIIAFSLWVYFRSIKDFEGLALIAKWTMIFVAITAVLSIYTSFMDPLYARKMTGGDLEEIEDLRKYGGGGYGFASALVPLFPMIIYYYRNNDKAIFSKTQILIFGIICFFTLIRMQIFANIIMSVVIILFALFGRKKLKNSLIVSIILLVIFLVIPRQVYSDFFIYLSSFFSHDSNVYLKLTDFATFVVEGGYEGAAGGRAARYPMLLEAFVNNPLMGHSYSVSEFSIGGGAHLYWMNKLTILGLVGFIPFVLIIFYHVKTNAKHFDKEFIFYYLLSVFSIVLLGLTKNLVGRTTWYMFFFILPALYYLPLLKKNKTKSMTKKN